MTAVVAVPQDFVEPAAPPCLRTGHTSRPAAACSLLSKKPGARPETRQAGTGLGTTLEAEIPTGSGEHQPCWIDPVLEERLRLTTKSSVGLPAAEFREVVVAEGMLNHHENGPSDDRERSALGLDH